MAAVGHKLLKKLTLRTFIGSKADILAYAMSGRPQREKKGKDGAVELEKDGKTPVMEGYGSEGEAVPLMRVVGNVTGYKADESDFGPYVELRGDFHATNLHTGEIMESANKCILPSVVGELVASHLKAGGESVQFAVEIDARFSEKAATMYEFDARSLVKPKVAQPIADMLAMMEATGIAMTKPLALAAPVLSDAEKNAQKQAEATADAAREAAKATANAKDGKKDKATTK